ncbi:hypothetical protein PAXRUDRAFT_827141 [Paxillus rubicundulus Ve08.2h10]|uniref:Thioredoxin domain-containing protein n=1 Tax=Paxillus rubicundulus Ve08.2h10 TaxID=930991 RepID=A0A0D0E3A9_9AGAM|nr:hypothetical protein PAXRUDRAFT_827141 [Paxillus rubicundulus Ve08.2h10]
MRPLALIPGLFAVAELANAQYFSAGWAPGQPVPTIPAHQQPPAARPAETAKKHSITPPKPSFLDNLVTGGPVSAFTSLIGFNISGTPEAVWDARIPLITDSNYADMIVNEEMTPEEEENRVWFIVITVTAGQPDGVSKFVDTTFDAAYNYTLEKGDLEHVRFGRIDYLDVTAITTRWAVWSAPTLVVLKDRGKTLRFYKGGQLRLTDELLHQFLKNEVWRHKKPWTSAYAPGGDREWILDYLANTLSRIYSWIVRVPKWLMYVLSGAVATFVINILHKPSKKVESKPKAASNPVAPAAPAPKAEAKATATSGQKAANKRRGKK